MRKGVTMLHPHIRDRRSARKSRVPLLAKVALTLVASMILIGIVMGISPFIPGL